MSGTVTYGSSGHAPGSPEAFQEIAPPRVRAAEMPRRHAKHMQPLRPSGDAEARLVQILHLAICTSQSRRRSVARRQHYAPWRAIPADVGALIRTWNTPGTVPPSGFGPQMPLLSGRPPAQWSGDRTTPGLHSCGKRGRHHLAAGTAPVGVGLARCSRGLSASADRASGATAARLRWRSSVSLAPHSAHYGAWCVAINSGCSVWPPGHPWDWPR